MNYTIEHKRLMELMEEFFKKNFPDIELPLVRKISSGKGNSGYGSAMHDYTYMNYHYYSQDDTNYDDSIFVEWDDRHLFSDEKWSVDPRFEMMYDFFGEQNFEEFVKYYFEFDITKRGNKKHNWMFY